MVLAGVNLADHTADARTIVAQKHKEVLNDESVLAKLVDQFHVG